MTMSALDQEFSFPLASDQSISSDCFEPSQKRCRHWVEVMTRLCLGGGGRRMGRGEDRVKEGGEIGRRRRKRKRE